MDADELTYPVHIMLRYELEKKILDGALPIARFAGGMEREYGAAAEHPADQRRRRLPAGHPLGAWGTSATFPPMRSGAVIAGQLNEAMRAERPVAR